MSRSGSDEPQLCEIEDMMRAPRMQVAMQAQSSDAGVTIDFMCMSHNGFQAVEREDISADILCDVCEATTWCSKPFNGSAVPPS